MEKHLRFLDLYHAGEVRSSEIDEYIERWHANQLTGPDSHVSLHAYLGMTWAEYSMWATLGDLPTRSEHEMTSGREDLVFVQFPDDEPGDLTPLRTHGPLRCRPTCPIHWPSDHPRADWQLGWDPEQGLITRVCGHGDHHPDPDDQQVRLHLELARHDCDGCCRPTIDGEVREALAQLDGTAESAVALLTGIPRDELSRYGGMSPRQS